MCRFSSDCISSHRIFLAPVSLPHLPLLPFLPPLPLLQVKGFQVTPECTTTMRFYAEHRLLRAPRFLPSSPIRGRGKTGAGGMGTIGARDEEDDDSVTVGESVTKHRTDAPAVPAHNPTPASFLYTPHLSSEELRGRLSAQMGVRCDLCGRGFKTDREVVRVQGQGQGQGRGEERGDEEEEEQRQRPGHRQPHSGNADSGAQSTSASAAMYSGGAPVPTTGEGRGGYRLNHVVWR